VFMDTANPSKPQLSILQRNPVGGNLEPVNLTPLFAWEKYSYDTAVVDTWGENIVVCAAEGDYNDRLMLVNTNQQYSVDVTGYGGNTLAKNGYDLYVGSPILNTVYKVFDGFDDLGMAIENFTSGKSDNYGEDVLKKTRYLQFRGLIDQNQAYEVYDSFDNEEDVLLGTIRGDQSYVDTSSPVSIGGNMLGTEMIGGGTLNTVYPYLTQLKIRTPKFRVRKLTFKALNTGYVDIEWQKDFDILTFEQRLPSKYRVQVYQSLDGTEHDLPNMP
jgi:hypothetical protein